MIGFDARKYFDYGIGTYIQQLIVNLHGLQSPHRFIAYVSRDDAPRITMPQEWKKIPVNYGKYSVDEILFLARQANKDGVQVFHEPHYTLPAGLASSSVVTIHDLIHIRFPRVHPFRKAYALAMISHAVKHSSRVIVDSEFTKIDILKSFSVDERKIEVIYLGIGAEFKPLKAPKGMKDFRKRFHLDNPYILFVGNAMPHKGLEHLLGAFALLRHREMNLAIIGGRLSQSESLAARAKALGISDRIRELGRVSSEDLVLAYNEAEVFVLPSLYEGFGLPAIEAMACGTPVVSSDGGALPETVGDAAVVFHRGSEGELADSIDQVLRDSRLCRTLIAEGLRNVRRFSWKETAKRTLQVYERVL